MHFSLVASFLLFLSTLIGYETPFTKISSEELRRCNYSTENPSWAGGDSEKVREYYKFHGLSQFDENMSFLASTMGVIIHGTLDQEQLGGCFEHFDIRKLLSDGPYDSPFLSNESQNLIYESLQDVPYVFDVHLHNLGYDEGNYISPESASHELAPWKSYFTFMALRYASGMREPKGSTMEARRRIHLYAGNFPKLQGWILPIHAAWGENRKCGWNQTCNYLKGHSALLTAKSFHCDASKLFPAVSVHPFDPKWEEKLTSAHAKGIRLVKWMPPQGIPPDASTLDTFYQKLVQLKMTLIAHSGHEHAMPIENSAWEDYGNPLRFRRPLQLGVNVILAHSGHNDLLPDLDDPNQTLVKGYELFFRLARESKNWKGKLYGDLAGVLTHYGPEFIEALLRASQEGIRLVYGSDYPYTNLVQPSSDAYDLSAEAGLLPESVVGPLKEIRDWNPLLANYVFARNLECRGIKFPLETFTGQFLGAELFLIDKSQWESFLAK